MTREALTLVWLLAYLAMMPFVGLIPAPQTTEARVIARGWPTIVVLTILIVGSIASTIAA